jgi:hypothetical protein
MTQGYTIGETDFAIGQTDFEYWGRLWKARTDDPEVEGEEWATFLERIQEHFRSNYKNFPDELYFWGDFSGDRTLNLKIAKPTGFYGLFVQEKPICVSEIGRAST